MANLPNNGVNSASVNPNPSSVTNIAIVNPMQGAQITPSIAVGMGVMQNSPPGEGNVASASASQSQQSTAAIPADQVQRWITSVGHWLEDREVALVELSKKRENIPELAPQLWNSFGVVASLLYEVVSVYPVAITPDRPESKSGGSSLLSPAQSNRVCNALALLQCLASHAETRPLFLKAQLPLYLFPLLRPEKSSRHFEYIRLTSLGVIGALVKADDPSVIRFLVSTEILPLCLRIMETGTELSRTVATFILQKMLLDDHGLNFICQATSSFERLRQVNTALTKLVNSVLTPTATSGGGAGSSASAPGASGGAESSTNRLLKHVIRCYLRLSDDPNARDQLIKYLLPEPIREALKELARMQTQSAANGAPLPMSSPSQSSSPATAQLIKFVTEESAVRKWLLQLLKNLDQAAAPGPSGVPATTALPMGYSEAQMSALSAAGLGLSGIGMGMGMGGLNLQANAPPNGAFASGFSVPGNSNNPLPSALAGSISGLGSQLNPNAAAFNLVGSGSLFN